MSNSQITKRAFWKSWIFWFVLIVIFVATYLIIVRIEEAIYRKFVNSEWPTYTIKYTEENSPLVGEYIKNLTADNKGRVRIGTDSALNVVAPDGSWTIYIGTQDGTWTISTNDTNGVNIQSVAIDKLERTWVGTFDALYVLNPNRQWETHDEVSKAVFEHYTSSAILVDRFDRIWVANNDGLRLFLPDGTKIFYTKENSGLTDDYITALAEDRQGNIWIGTRTKGVVVFDQNGQWKTYQADGSKNGLIENWITAILIDDRDRVWVGTVHRGISMLSTDGNWTTYDVTSWGRQSNPEYYDKEVNAFAMDEQGRLWIGTSDGLFALDTDGNWIVYNKVNSGLNPDWIKALTIDGSGQLWIATLQEVFVLDLQNKLPEPVSNLWVHLRHEMLTPIKVVKNWGEILFFPAIFFRGYSLLNFCSITYIVLLVLIIPAIFGMRWSAVQKNQNYFAPPCLH